MSYRGRYDIFDPRRIKTYPVSSRQNKVSIDDLVRPADALEMDPACPVETTALVAEIAGIIVDARRKNRPVILFTGAHLIKNGLGPLVVDLIDRGMVTLVAGNGATSIHDFELTMIGETSESVPNALPKGLFGMAFEFAYWNAAVARGFAEGLGLGESLGRMIEDAAFRGRSLTVIDGAEDLTFPHRDVSILSMGYRRAVPVTIHVGIGADVVDQHASFDGAAKGGASGRDFLIFANEIARMADGGVVLNIGSAVTGPEVLLKAVSMAANIGKGPRGLITADFDMRPASPQAMTDESSPAYYFRDQKSVVTRIPQSFGGCGYYIEGNQKATLPILYREIMRRIPPT